MSASVRPPTLNVYYIAVQIPVPLRRAKSNLTYLGYHYSFNSRQILRSTASIDGGHQSAAGSDSGRLKFQPTQIRGRRLKINTWMYPLNLLLRSTCGDPNTKYVQRWTKKWALGCEKFAWRLALPGCSVAKQVHLLLVHLCIWKSIINTSCSRLKKEKWRPKRAIFMLHIFCYIIFSFWGHMWIKN